MYRRVFLVLAVLAAAIVMVLPIKTQLDASTTYIEDFADLLAAIRFQTQVLSTNSVADSVLWEMADRAYIHTSTDIGGNEAEYLITLADGDPIYALPDSVCAILAITIYNSDSTIQHSCILWNPEFYEKDFPIQQLDDAAGEDQVPFAYSVNDDVIKFFPTPVQTSYASLDCLVEHSSARTGGTYDSTFTMRLPAKLNEAAIFRACQLLELAYHGDRAAIFEQQYDKIKASVQAQYEERYGRFWKRN